MSSPKVIIPVGVIGSGKSHYGRKLAADDSSLMIVSDDDIRTMIYGKYSYKPPYEYVVSQLFTGLITTILRNRCSVYADIGVSCLSASNRKGLINSIKKEVGDVRFEAVYFKPDVLCLQRRMSENRGLSNSHWTKVYIEQLAEIKEPLFNEGFDSIVHFYGDSRKSKITPYGLQVNFCVKNKIPVFAPAENCSHCGRNIWTIIKSDTAESEHITSCPFCNKSFCS